MGDLTGKYRGLQIIQGVCIGIRAGQLIGKTAVRIHLLWQDIGAQRFKRLLQQRLFPAKGGVGRGLGIPPVSVVVEIVLFLQPQLTGVHPVEVFGKPLPQGVH